MKKILSLLLCMLMVLAPLSHVGAQTLFTPGTYEGTGAGFGGDITVKVTVSVDKVSKSAEQKIVAAGGSIK